MPWILASPSSSDWPRHAVEIALLFVVIYTFLRFLRKTVAGGIVRGSALIVWALIIGVFFLVHELRLDALDWILSRAVPLFLVSLVVLFQPELRHGLARLSEVRFFKRFTRRADARFEESRAVDELTAAVSAFSGRRTGALIAIERSVDLSTYADTGVRLDAILRAETLDTIFTTKTLLHDGAVIVRGDRIAAAGCLLPLTERPHLARSYGTRHRAAIGLSEQSDALVIVVSEETGSVHVAEHGELEAWQNIEWLTAILSAVMAEKIGVAKAAP